MAGEPAAFPYEKLFPRDAFGKFLRRLWTKKVDIFVANGFSISYSTRVTMTAAPIQFSKQNISIACSQNSIEAESLSRRFGSVIALDAVTLQIREGEFFSLLGPSGCGKTTLLRIIAGLDTPDSGTLTIVGLNAKDIPAHKRPVNTVFQNYALFPHLSVWDNVAFGLRMKKVYGVELNSRVEKALDLVEVRDLAKRMPHQISGGQKQRVALARAVVNEPKVLLLDEPLGALDLKLRKQLQVQLHQLQRRLGITFIHVTHDQEEALVMSDRIALMNAGRIEQLDSAKNIYESPRTRFVAEFLGACNLISGVVTEVNSIEASFGQIFLSQPLSTPRGVKISIAIRPEKLSVQRHSVINETTPGRNLFSATIEDRTYSGAETQLCVRIGEQLLRVTQLNSGGQNDVTQGERVHIQFPESAVILLQD
jgi:spermidine/putrescine transport system ATP-binding protein